MKFIDAARRWIKSAAYRDLWTYDDLASALRATAGGTTTGEVVNHETALSVGAVLAGARVLAEGIAQVPFKLYGPKRAEQRDNPLYDLLYLAPNDFQTSFEFREQMMLHAVLCGDHYAFINRLDGEIAELLPMEPGKVTVSRAADGELLYKYRRENGEEQLIAAKDVWHTRGPSWNGWKGLDILHLARESIGLSMTLERDAARQFSQGVNASGVLSVEGTVDDENYKKLRRWLTEHHSGQNSRMPMVLDRGAKWYGTKSTNTDAQFVENRRQQVEEICRFLRVMPIMIGQSDKATTYASAEQMFLAHVVHSLSPWYSRIEQSAARCLLSPAQRAAGLYFRFTEEGLLRGSIEATSNVLDKLVNGGIMYPEEARSKLDLPPDGSDASGKLRIPANIVGKQNGPSPDPAA